MSYEDLNFGNMPSFLCELVFSIKQIDKEIVYAKRENKDNDKIMALSLTKARLEESLFKIRPEWK